MVKCPTYSPYYQHQGNIYPISPLIIFTLSLLLFSTSIILRTGTDTARFFYLLLEEEDGLIENITFLSFLVTGLIAATIAKHTTSTKPKLLYIAAFLLFLFIAGEEISWGQRLIGFSTPEPLQHLNDQGETTIHNILAISFLFHYGFSITCFLLTILSITSLLITPTKRIKWRTPHWCLILFFLYPSLNVINLEILDILIQNIASDTAAQATKLYIAGNMEMSEVVGSTILVFTEEIGEMMFAFGCLFWFSMQYQIVNYKTTKA